MLNWQTLKKKHIRYKKKDVAMRYSPRTVAKGVLPQEVNEICNVRPMNKFIETNK